MKQNIMKYLAPPGKLASTLDWKKASGSILAIDVGCDRIGMAVAVHPSHGDEPMRLEPMPLTLETHKDGNKRILCESVVKELQKVVKTYNTVGLLVSWPVQKQGRVGAPCGKVLHTLDQLVEQSSSIISSNRPFSLWDDHHFSPDDDAFGRSAKYASCPTKNKTLYYASQEQYAHKCSSSVAAAVWDDFCLKHWPELYHEEQYDDSYHHRDMQEEQQSVSSASSSSSSYQRYFEDDWLESTEESETYTNAGLL